MACCRVDRTRMRLVWGELKYYVILIVVALAPIPDSADRQRMVLRFCPVHGPNEHTSVICIMI
jgi:hypothetical protein